MVLTSIFAKPYSLFKALTKVNSEIDLSLVLIILPALSTVCPNIVAYAEKISLNEYLFPPFIILVVAIVIALIKPTVNSLANTAGRAASCVTLETFLNALTPTTTFCNSSSTIGSLKIVTLI
jgi:hypothetical protein